MTDLSGHDRFYTDLVADLRPVRRLRSPLRRAALWIAFVLASAVALALLSDLSAVAHRLMIVPDMWLAVLGSSVTAVLAALAAFQLSLPDRSPAWALLPLPGLALWVGASGLGCARTWLIPGAQDASWADTGHCLTFIVGLSIPLSVLIIVMLRRGYALYPSLTAAVAGLAVASAAATLLNFFHPFDASLDDLAVHAFAVLIVVIANRLFGGSLLTRKGGIGVAR